MELFIVNRYLGQDAEKVPAPNENDLKEKLLHKVKERKKLRENKLNSTSLQPLELLEEKEKTKKKKSRKRKPDEDDGNTEDGNGENESVNEKVKKKKGKLLGENSSLVNGNIILEQDSLIIKRKKKKEKKMNKDVNKIKDDFCETTMVKEKMEENDTVGTDFVKEITSNQAFTVLGKDQNSKKLKLKRVLPAWLANPSIVSVDLKKLNHTIDSIPLLEKKFLNKLRENNITHFFPVQVQLIPWLLNDINNPSMYWSNDACVSAPTGSGKTLAFVLPIIQALHNRLTPQIRAIIVLPVQELANQVFKVFETYCSPTEVKVVLLTKMRSLKDEQKLLVKYDEISGYQNLADIIVTTPGRLVDHLNSTPGLTLHNLRYLVIDEADRVMENMQNDWLVHLNKRISQDHSKFYQATAPTLANLTSKRRPPQKLLFSATLSQDPEKLQQLGLYQPKLFTSFVKSETSERRSNQDPPEGGFVGKFTTPAELKEFFSVCAKATKPLVIHYLMEKLGWKNILCFVNSIETTVRLTLLLRALSRNKVKIGKISAKLDVQKRNQIISKFAKGVIDVLISTDSLARGIDIPNVKYVVSYDPPKYAKAYIHRIGRTGRAGKEGSSLILLNHDEVNHFQELLRAAGKSSVNELPISHDQLKEYEESFANALTKVKKKLEISQSRLLGRRKAVKFLNKKPLKRKQNKLQKN